MEMNVTTVVNGIRPMNYSASIMEIGQDAGTITWSNAIDDSDHLIQDYDRAATIEHFADYGAWSNDELNASDDTELKAMLLQEIAAEMREHDITAFWDKEQWGEYMNSDNAGRLFMGDDEQIYFYIGS